MKKNTSIAILILCSLATARAQTNTIKLNILAPIVKTANVQYEKAFGNKSFQLGAFYTGFKQSTTKFSGFGITPEFRFYLSDTPAPQGFYAAPFLRYQNFTIEGTDPNASAKGTLSTFGGGLIIGKQWIFKEKVVLDIFLGPAYNSGKVKATSGNADNLNPQSFDGFGVRTGVCFGLAF